MLNEQEAELLRRMQISQRLGMPMTQPWGAIFIPEGKETHRQAILSVQPHGPRPLDLVFPGCPPHRVELLGLVVEQLPPERIRPYIALGMGLTLEVWLATCRLANGLAGAEVSWPSTGAESHIMLQHGQWRADDVTTIASAIKWLETIPRLGGRQSTSDEDAMAEAVRLGMKWLQDHPGAEPKGFTREQFRRERCVGPDAIKQWMREKHFTIREVQRELERQFQRPA